MEGIVYTLTNDEDRAVVKDYHRKPSPLHLGKTKYTEDISVLKKKDIAKHWDGDNLSKFTIGFEVEKNELHRESIREYELFCGFERDGSCGYEAVTHILPLVPASPWRNKVYDMMWKAERIIDDEWSPSDKRCGGHITIAVDGMKGDELRRKIRNNCGIIYALFRHRLKNQYCGSNSRMLEHYSNGISINHTDYGARFIGSFHNKYQLALVKGDALEFRLPSRISSVRQLIDRYELMYELLDHSINARHSHEVLLQRIRPIIVSMYGGNEAKADHIIALARDFRTFIMRSKITDSVREFVDPHNAFSRLWV